MALFPWSLATILLFYFNLKEYSTCAMEILTHPQNTSATMATHSVVLSCEFDEIAICMWYRNDAGTRADKHNVYSETETKNCSIEILNLHDNDFTVWHCGMKSTTNRKKEITSRKAWLIKLAETTKTLTEAPVTTVLGSTQREENPYSTTKPGELQMANSSTSELAWIICGSLAMITIVGILLFLLFKRPQCIRFSDDENVDSSGSSCFWCCGSDPNIYIFVVKSDQPETTDTDLPEHVLNDTFETHAKSFFVKGRFAAAAYRLQKRLDMQPAMFLYLYTYLRRARIRINGFILYSYAQLITFPTKRWFSMDHSAFSYEDASSAFIQATFTIYSAVFVVLSLSARGTNCQQKLIFAAGAS